MSKSPSLRRIQADIRELARDPSDRYYAAPLENDMFEWYVIIVFLKRRVQCSDKYDILYSVLLDSVP